MPVFDLAPHEAASDECCMRHELGKLNKSSLVVAFRAFLPRSH